MCAPACLHPPFVKRHTVSSMVAGPSKTCYLVQKMAQETGTDGPLNGAGLLLLDDPGHRCAISLHVLSFSFPLHSYSFSVIPFHSLLCLSLHVPIQLLHFSCHFRFSFMFLSMFPHFRQQCPFGICSKRAWAFAAAVGARSLGLGLGWACAIAQAGTSHDATWQRSGGDLPGIEPGTCCSQCSFLRATIQFISPRSCALERQYSNGEQG